MNIQSIAKIKTPIAGQVQSWEQLKLSVIEAQRWNETRVGLLWSQPAFADVLYSMMVGPNGEQAWFTDKVDTAATDDKYMYLNPKKFLSRDLEDRIFIACHEIWHAMMGHCGIMHRLRTAGVVTYPDGVTLKYDENTMQIAADCVINDGLVQAKIGRKPKDAWHKPQLINAKMSIVDAYRKLYKNQSQMGGAGGVTINSEGGGSFDVHLTPGQGRGKTPAEAQSDRNQPAWDAAITAAMENCKQRGVGSFDLKQAFGKIVEPEIPWQELLRTAFNRRVGNGQQTWETLDSEFIIRGIGAPGHLSWGAGRVIVAQDSSGSILQPMSDIFMSETGGIVDDARPRELILCQCDDAILQWEEVQDTSDLRRMMRRGNGGTSFVPVFEKIEREMLEPDILIYFTDMDGAFPTKKPSYPVIWASIVETPYRGVPFGDFVYVPLKRKD